MPNQAGRILRHLLHKRSAQIGGFIFLLLIFLALFGPLVTPYDAFDIQVKQRLQSPSLQHIFGTDEQGRDLFSRILYGARYALEIMLVTTTIGAAGGLLFGLPSAYFGGAADMLVMRLMDIMLGFPYILLILAIVAIIGPSLDNAMIAIGVAGIPSFARLARSAILVVKEQDFVTAERALGASHMPDHVPQHPAQHPFTHHRLYFPDHAHRRAGSSLARASLDWAPSRPSRVGRHAGQCPRFHRHRSLGGAGARV